MFSLRDYQEEAVDNIITSWNDKDAVLAQLPTGTGKTEIMIEVSKRRGGRTLFIAPMDTLINQTADKIYKRSGIYPDIEQATQKADRFLKKNPYVVASYQTLMRGGGDRYRRLRGFSTVIEDEAHFGHSKARKNMLAHFMDKGAKVLGVSATLQRHDGRSLKAMGYEKLAYNLGIQDAITKGWLVGVHCELRHIESIDFSLVRSHAGKRKDFREEDLNRQIEKDSSIYEIASVVNGAWGKEKTAVYCNSIKVAEGVAGYLRDHFKLPSDFICSDTSIQPEEEKNEIIRRFTQEGSGLDILCNVGILTTGWDFPGLKRIINARPTKSLPLYTQIFGRGPRPLPGVVDFEGSTQETRKERIRQSEKPYFTMIDLTGNSLEHKIITPVDVLSGRMTIKEPTIDQLKAYEIAQEKLSKATEAETNPMGLFSESYQEAVEERKRKIEEQRKMRAQVAVQSEISRQKVNPFGGPQYQVPQYPNMAGNDRNWSLICKLSALTGNPKSNYFGRSEDSLKKSLQRERKKCEQKKLFPWGKFVGKKIEDAPEWYVDYLLKHMEENKYNRWLLKELKALKNSSSTK